MTGYGSEEAVEARRRRRLFGTPAGSAHKSLEAWAGAAGWAQVLGGRPGLWAREGRAILVYVEPDRPPLPDGRPRRRRARTRWREHADLAARAGLTAWWWHGGRLLPLAAGQGEPPFGGGALPDGVEPA